MSTTGTPTGFRKARKLRTLLETWMEEVEVPAVCLRIRKARESIIDPDTGRVLSQAAAGSRLKPRVTEKTWRSWETRVEPSMRRLRQIAVALELPEEHFLPSEDLSQAIARVEAEADRFRLLGDGLEEVLAALQSQIEETRRARPQRGRKQSPPRPD